MTTFGGVLDGVGFYIPGAAKFVAGQEVVLFVGRAVPGQLGVVDLGPGLVEIDWDGSGAAGRRLPPGCLFA